MVKELGMSDKVGLRTHESQSNELMSFNDLSPATNELIDNEIKRIMQVNMYTFFLINYYVLKLCYINFKNFITF